MSLASHKYRPEVQARRVGTVTKNSFTREQYIAALEAVGEKNVRSLSKGDAWVRVRNTPGAERELITKFSWQNRQ